MEIAPTQTKTPVLSINHQVTKLLRSIEEEGLRSAPRGLKVKEMELYQMPINPNFSLMDFTQREFNWKYFMGELSWYLLKDTNIDWINNFSTFWKGIANDAGHINSNYGAILFGDQLDWALRSLKKDHNTRQAVCFLNRPTYQYDGNKDFVCTMYLNFWIRDNRLNMKVQMRSNDIFYGLTYDAPFFAFLQQSMHMWLKGTYPDLQLGTYYHCADNIHYYERHFKLVENILSSDPGNTYFFQLREPMFTIKDGNYLILEPGRQFLTDVAALVNSGEEITQTASREILTKYFYIQ